MNIQAPKGTKDVVPQESGKWQYLESVIRGVAAKYGINEVRTPVIEHTELFARGVGDTTDIVQKEMYTFPDKGGRSITLKPEGTAGVVRMYIENKLFNEAQPTKMYYLYNPIFRYERPQAGRLREHHQFGIEVFGSPEASVDAECISVAVEVLEKIGLKNLEVKLNSIGCPECRPKYNAALKAYLEAHKDSLCSTCVERLERNPLRILDCKNEECKEICRNAPHVLDWLCDDCAGHFEKLKKYLDIIGIKYSVDPMIVRGLDYYTKTVFEIVSSDIGSQSAVGGGGRYDLLVGQLGGTPTPAVGFGMGMERVLLVAQNQGVKFPEPSPFDLYVVSAGEKAYDAAYKLTSDIRGYGMKADCDHMGRSVKAQFKYAGKLNVRYVATIGDEELETNTVRLKEMASGIEETVNINDVKTRIRELTR
ncbi:MAG: histidine--tRNA ligase [Christensenellales bacterium]